MEKLVFLRETRHAFGRTALLLSGGATLTMYHLGVIKALFQADLLPRVISGSSGGAIVAAWVCTSKDDELLTNLDADSIRFGPFEELSVGSLRRKVTDCSWVNTCTPSPFVVLFFSNPVAFVLRWLLTAVRPFRPSPHSPHTPPHPPRSGGPRCCFLPCA